MKIQVDGVTKQQRLYFKEGILKAINGKGNIYFTLDKAIIETSEPYLVTEDSLITKSRNKKAINEFIAEYRVYQFNSN